MRVLTQFILLLFIAFSFSNVATATTFNNVLVDASDRGDVAEVRRLLDSGIKPDSLGEFGVTPLMRAAFRDHVEIAEILIKSGAYVNASDIGGDTALHMAARAGNARMVKLLLHFDASVNVVDNQQWSPLMRAIMAKSPEVTKILSEKGANLNARNNIGNTPLVLASISGKESVLEVLLSSKRFSEISADQREGSINVARKREHSKIMNMISSASEFLKSKEESEVKQASNYSSQKLEPESDSTTAPYDTSINNGLSASNLSDANKTVLYKKTAQSSFVEESPYPQKTVANKVVPAYFDSNESENVVHKPQLEKQKPILASNDAVPTAPYDIADNNVKTVNTESSNNQKIVDAHLNVEKKTKPIEPAFKSNPMKPGVTMNFSGDSYTIQMGAFSKKSQADSTWKRHVNNHSDILSGLAPSIIEVSNSGGGAFYRLRVGSFKVKATAGRKCKEMQSRKIDCFVVKKPRGAVPVKNVEPSKSTVTPKQGALKPPPKATNVPQLIDENESAGEDKVNSKTNYFSIVPTNRLSRPRAPTINRRLLQRGANSNKSIEFPQENNDNPIEISPDKPLNDSSSEPLQNEEMPSQSDDSSFKINHNPRSYLYKDNWGGNVNEGNKKLSNKVDNVAGNSRKVKFEKTNSEHVQPSSGLESDDNDGVIKSIYEPIRIYNDNSFVESNQVLPWKTSDDGSVAADAPVQSGIEDPLMSSEADSVTSAKDEAQIQESSFDGSAIELDNGAEILGDNSVNDYVVDAEEISENEVEDSNSPKMPWHNEGSSVEVDNDQTAVEPMSVATPAIDKVETNADKVESLPWLKAEQTNVDAKVKRSDFVYPVNNNEEKKHDYSSFYEDIKTTYKKSDVSEAVLVKGDDSLPWLKNKTIVKKKQEEKGVWLEIYPFPNKATANDYADRMFKYDEGLKHLDIKLLGADSPYNRKVRLSVGPISTHGKANRLCKGIIASGLKCFSKGKSYDVNFANDNNVRKKSPPKDFVSTPRMRRVAVPKVKKDDRPFWVNLGAFSNSYKAEYYLMFLREDHDDILNGVNHEVHNVKQSSRRKNSTAVKLKLGPYVEKLQADNMCEMLRRRNVSCLVMK